MNSQEYKDAMTIGLKKKRKFPPKQKCSHQAVIHLSCALTKKQQVLIILV